MLELVCKPKYRRLPFKLLVSPSMLATSTPYLYERITSPVDSAVLLSHSCLQRRVEVDWWPSRWRRAGRLGVASDDAGRVERNDEPRRLDVS
jgi:hypothetical protein